MGFHLFTFSCVKVFVCLSVVFLFVVSESVDVKVFGRLGVLEFWGLGFLGFLGFLGVLGFFGVFEVVGVLGFVLWVLFLGFVGCWVFFGVLGS